MTSCNSATAVSFKLTASSSSSLSLLRHDRNPRARIRISSRIPFRNLLYFAHRCRGFDFAKSIAFHAQTRLFEADRRCSSSDFVQLSSLELPLLPFDVKEVLVPSETKTLHLYEARYLALLEESLLRKDKLFVHFVLDPIDVSDSSGELSFAARYGCLVSIENVERLDVGALVSIRGIGRVKITELLQADPYLRGVILPVNDTVLEDAKGLITKMMDIKDALHNLNGLEMKLKAPKEALLQTRILNSLVWAEKDVYEEDIDENFIPSLAERVSYAPFQPISGSSESELLNLQIKKLKAMDMKNTLERLDDSLELTKVNISTVVAKLAIQSVKMQ